MFWRRKPGRNRRNSERWLQENDYRSSSSPRVLSEYGLLGITIASATDNEALKLEVPWTACEDALWESALLPRNRYVHAGLPQERRTRYSTAFLASQRGAWLPP